MKFHSEDYREPSGLRIIDRRNAAKSRMFCGGKYGYQQLNLIRSAKSVEKVQEIIDDLYHRIIFVPIYLFGAADLYYPIRGDIYFSIFLKVNHSNLEDDIKDEEILKYLYSQEFEILDDTESNEAEFKIDALVISRKDKDEPFKYHQNMRLYEMYDMNFHKGYIPRSETLTTLLTLKGIQEILAERARLYPELIDASLNIYNIKMSEDDYQTWNDGCDVDLMSYFDSEDTKINNDKYFSFITDMGLKHYVSDRINYTSDEFYNIKDSLDPKIGYGSTYEGIFVNILGTQIYQFMTFEDLDRLRTIEKATIAYGYTNDMYSSNPNEWTYKFSYDADTSLEILRNAIMMAVDIDHSNYIAKGDIYRKTANEVMDQNAFSPRKLYDSLFLILRKNEINLSFNMTISEMTARDRYDGTDKKVANGIGYTNGRNHIGILSLILNLSDIYTSMKIPSYEYDKRYRY